MQEVESIRKRVRATYIMAEKRKGFKGYWQMKYVLHDVICLENNSLISSIVKINDVACIKGKKFKEGDILEFDARIVKNKKGGYTITRPTKLELVRHKE